MDARSDDELVRCYRAAPDSARGRSCLNQLFERHHARVAAWCVRMTGDVESAGDLAQEIFLRAFQRINSFRGECRFTTWLYSIARNRCMDELRSRAGRLEESGDAPMDEIPDSRSEEISSVLVRQEAEQVVRQIMRETLDATEAQVMTLHYVEELPLDSITRLLGLTNASGAKAYVVGARRKIERALAEWKMHQAKGGNRVR